jgi:hypothetical protein
MFPLNFAFFEKEKLQMEGYVRNNALRSNLFFGRDNDISKLNCSLDGVPEIIERGLLATQPADPAPAQPPTPTTWVFEVDQKTLVTATPQTSIQTFYCEPLVPTTIKIGTEEEFSEYWSSQKSALNDEDKNRGNAFRAASGVYDEVSAEPSPSPENSQATKTPEAIQADIIQTHLDIILIAARGYETDNKGALTYQEVLETIKFAKENGGVSKMKIGGDLPAEKLTDFSALYQEKMKECAIYTGRKNYKNLVGSRITFLPKEVLDALQKDDFKEKFNEANKEKELKSAKNRIKEKTERVSKVLSEGKGR